MDEGLPAWLGDRLRRSPVSRLCREAVVLRPAAIEPRPAVRLPAVRVISCVQGRTDHLIPGPDRVLRLRMRPGTSLLVDRDLPIAPGPGRGAMFNAVFAPDRLRAVWFPRPHDGSHRQFEIAFAAWPIVQDLLAALHAQGRETGADAVSLHVTRALLALAYAALRAGPALRVGAVDLPALRSVIDELLPAPISRAQVARIVGVHPNHLSRIVSAQSGDGFSRLVLRRRLHYARACAQAEPGISMAELAQRAGFSSPSYFSQVCRRILGVPPGAWAALP